MGNHSRRDVLLASAVLSAAAVRPAIAAAATNPPPTLPPALRTRFDSYCVDQKLPGAMLAVVRRGRLEGCYGYGKASVPFDVPVAPTTLFHIASMSKHVTALAVLRLVERNKLSIDDPIGKHVTGLIAWMNPLPIRLMLGHISGIADYEAGFTWDRPFDHDALMKSVPDPIGRPRETLVYSNSAYAILGWLIEAVSGKSYVDYVQDELFKPAGLPLARADAADMPVVGRAEPYHWVDGILHHATRMDNAVSHMSDGGLLFSALDWAPWLDAVDQGKIVSPDLLASMYEPGLLLSGRVTNYGFGWFLEKVRGRDVRSHTGSVPGFRSRILRYPAAELTAIFQTNGDPAFPMGTFLEEVIEHYRPGTTFLSLPGQPEPSSQRAKHLAAYLAGQDDEATLAPELVLAEKAAKRPPGPRIAHQPIEISLLDTYPLPNGSASRYRIDTGERPVTMLIGWSAADQIYFVR
ncbi:serine hydrolase domain-containing protein [uncultured Sphingomonas sp.]|uniref:serine hydrolase domain-containing protein n=1 Tax=uncultured Sphingomonas sp. TaxID=158754 RepID=UPI0035CA9976